MTRLQKKEWSTPKLRIFARTKTEETVLWLCKHEVGSLTGPLYRNSTCYFNTVCSSRCESALGS